MESVDGDVRLSVGFNTKSVKDNLTDLKKAISDALKEFSATSNINNQIADLQKSIENATKSVDKLSQKLEKLSKEDVSNKSYEELSKDLTNANSKFDEISGKQQSLADAGKTTTDEFAALEAEANKVGEEIRAIEARMQELTQASSNVTTPIDTTSYDKVEDALKTTETEFDIAKEKAEEFNSAVETPTNADVHKLNEDLKQTETEFNNAKDVAGEFNVDTSTATDGVSSKLLQLQANVAKAAEKIELAKAKLQEFESKPATPTADYSALLSQLDSANAEFDKLYNKQQQWLSIGISPETAAFKDLDAQIEKVGSSIQDLTNKKKQMESEGTAFKSDEAKYQQLINSLQSAEREYEIAKVKLNEFNDTQNSSGAAAQNASNSTNRVGTSATNTADKIAKLEARVKELEAQLKKLNKSSDSSGNKLSGIASKAGSAFSKLKSTVKSVFSSISKSVKNTSKTSESAFSNINGAVKKGIKTFLKYGFSIKSLYILFRKLKQFVAEGYKNLAGYSDEVNQSVSSVLSALTKLKNSLAAAVQPIVNIVAPILTSLINKLSEAANAVGQFLAAFTGQSYVYQAVDTQTQYVESLEDTTSAAEDAEKALNSYLSPLDDINTFTPPDTSVTKDTTSDTDKEADPSKMFKTTVVDSKFKELADKIKGYFSDIFEPVQSAWNKYGKSVIDAWQKALKSIISLIKSIGAAFIAVWTNGTGERFIGNILKLVTLVGKAIDAFATSFKNAWDEGKRGEKFIQSIFDLFNSILELIFDIGDALITVWSNGTGERIIGHILEIFTNINDIISNIAKNFSEAWNTDNLGIDIIQGLADILDTILRHINNIAKKTADWAKSLDFTPILSAFKNLVDAIEPLVDIIMGGLEWAWENVLLPLGKWTIESGIPTILNGIADALNLITGNGQSAFPVMETLGTVFDNVASGVGSLWSALSNLFGIILQNLGPIVSGIESYVGGLATLVSSITTTVSEAFAIASEGINTWITEDGAIIDEFIGNITETIGWVFEFVGGIFEDIGNIISEWWNGEGGKEIFQNVIDMFTNIGTTFMNIWNDWIQPVIEFIKGALQSAWDNALKPVFEKLVSFIGKVADAISAIWNNWLSPLVNFIVDTLGPVFTNVFNAVGAVFDTVFTIIGDVVGGILDALGGLLDFIVGVFTGDWEKAWQGICDFFGGIWDAIWGLIKGVINLIIDGINLLWTGIYTVVQGIVNGLGGIAGAIGDLFGQDWHFSMPSEPPLIPKLAQGAVIPPNKEFMAILGDQKSGNNIEAPESLIRQIVREESGTSGGKNVYEVPIKIGRKTLFKLIIDEAKLTQAQTGQNPFELA